MIDGRQNAEKIAKAVTFEYGEPSGPLIISTKDAVEKNSLFPDPTGNLTRGDAKGQYYMSIL